MISAKEITNRKFEKSAFGYKPDDVDQFSKGKGRLREKNWPSC